MPEYRLLYRVKTALRRREDISLTYAGSAVQFLFSKRGNASSVLAQVELGAANFAEAQAHAAGQLIPPVLDALSFATGTTSLLGECEITQKKEPGKRKRRAIYVGQRAVPRTVELRNALVEQTRSILTHEQGPRLPLCWLRYSHQRDLTLEKFVFAWLAFEELAGDTNISSECPNCGAPMTHRGANKERAWDLFHDANPTVERRHFDREVWGRARNSLFHGSRYPDPEFLSFLAATTSQVQQSVERELRRVFETNPDWERQRGPEELFRVFLFFEWETATPDADFAEDWPAEELRALVADADLDEKIRVGAFKLTLLNAADFENW